MRTAHQSVLHGIVVDVVEVPRQVRVVADRVLPKPPLPNPASAISLMRRTLLLFDATRGEPCLSETLLHQCPSFGEVRVAVRQRPDRVQMVGQKYERLDVKRPALLAPVKGFAQTSTRHLVTQEAGAVLRHQREEEGSTRHNGAAIPGHGRSVAQAMRTVRTAMGGWSAQRTLRLHVSPVESAARTRPCRE